MSDVQSLKSHGQEYAQPAAPQLDQSLWLAWKDKNRAKDRIRAARRQRVMLLALIAGALALILKLAITP